MDCFADYTTDYSADYCALDFYELYCYPFSQEFYQDQNLDLDQDQYQDQNQDQNQDQDQDQNQDQDLDTHFDWVDESIILEINQQELQLLQTMEDYDDRNYDTFFAPDYREHRKRNCDINDCI